jgi:hypothetical protein
MLWLISFRVSSITDINWYATMLISAFWNMMPCCLVHGGTNVFRGTSCLHFQKMEVAGGSSEMLVPIFQTTCHMTEGHCENPPVVWSCCHFMKRYIVVLTWFGELETEYTISLLEKLGFNCYGSVNWNYVFPSRDVIGFLPWPSQQKLG